VTGGYFSPQRRRDAEKELRKTRPEGAEGAENAEEEKGKKKQEGAGEAEGAEKFSF
jgi:hypothetical protein